MYGYAQHIPQPPHTSGQAFQGLRAAIDPRQAPSPIDAIEADRNQWENREFQTLPGSHVPLSTTQFVALDQGNSSPKFLRVSTWAVPASGTVADDCGIPLAVMLQPFADPDHPREEPVPVVQCPEDGPLRCVQCRAYLNPWIKWVAGGQRWQCNLCRKEMDVPPEYFSPLTPSLIREDLYNRPELCKGTVDFSIPASCTAYWAPPPPPRITPPYYSPLPDPPRRAADGREPRQMDFVVALDVSRDAVGSGFLRSVCDALRSVLFGEDEAAPLGDDREEDSQKEEGKGGRSADWPRGSRVAIVTFDRTLHFYHLGSLASSPPMIVVPDIEEPFSPLADGLFVDPYDPRARQQIHSLLSALPDRYQQTAINDSCLGSALRASMACLANRGGAMLVFQSTLPRVGPGALNPSTSASTSALFNTDKEYTLYVPADKTWPQIGEEMVGEGVGVCMWIAGEREVGVGSIGVVSSMTGGDIFFHPRFHGLTDGPILLSQLRRVCTRTMGFNASLKIRCSPGLRIASSSYRGCLFQRHVTEVEFGILTADHAVSAAVQHTQRLDEREQVYLQSAVLYTTVRGERRVRVCNVALPVVALPGNVFEHADMETVVCHLAREAISHRTSQPMNHIREDLTEKCSMLLMGYRRNCGASTPHSQLLIPEAFRSLPVYTLGILKSKPLKGRNVSPDVRNYYAHRLLSMSVRSTIQYLYPRLLALHDLSADIALPDPTTGDISCPSLMRDSHIFMTSNGVYLIDNEEFMVFWIGANVSPAILDDLFGVDDIMKLNPSLTKLPELQTTLSTQVRNILTHRQSTRGWTPKMLIARQNIDATEIEFSDMLVEDQNNAAMSYLDYLCLIHKQINHALTHGGSISGASNFRGSPW